MIRPRERLLVIKLADLGDAITATPALHALHAAYPSVRLDVLTSAVGASVMADLPEVDRVLVADRHLLDSPRSALRPSAWRRTLALIGDLRRHRYDTVIFMHHLTTAMGALKWRILASALRPAHTVGLDNGRGRFFGTRVPDLGFAALHEVEYALRLAEAVGAPPASPCLRVSLTPKAEEGARSLLGTLQRQRFAVVHPGSGSYSLARRWAPERFAAVADELVRRYALPVVVVGSAHDGVDEFVSAAHERHHNLAGRTDVPTLAAVLRSAAFFLGGDSGVMHLAAAAGTPLLSLFGPTDPRAWGPWRPPACGSAPAAVLQGHCPYDGPCLYRGHTLGQRDGCPGHDCLRDLTVPMVLERIRALALL